MNLLSVIALLVMVMPMQGWLFAPSLQHITKESGRINRDILSSKRAQHQLSSPNYFSDSCRSIHLTMSADAATAAQPETYAFESNVARVMDIIINSLYSNKDVFLRELISNAADACDKKRYISATGGDLARNLTIHVHANREKNTLTIEDNGVGMNKADLIQNLGRIAESGTKRFIDNTNLNSQNKDDLSLIGQFGVGFYSGFLVAKQITVITKGSDGQQWKWEASASSLGQYTITPDDSEPIEGSGTKIILSLRDEADQYLDEVALKALIERYSEFISFPIMLQRNMTRPEQVPDLTAPKEPDGSTPMKTVMKRVVEWHTVNEKKPLWLRSPRTCTQDDYNEFYKQTFKAFDLPAAQAHFAVEGNVDFRALLYVPSEVPYELTKDMFNPSARSMRLYVRRVFINDKFEDLIPRWLIFLRGVVDSDDLPLNVGREILQQSRSLRVIKQRLIKKTIDMFNEIATKPLEYQKFWKNFGKYLKLGVIDEEKMRDELVPLLRFYTSSSTQELTSLPEYVRRMPPDQKYIYYVVGETKAQAAMSPALERLRSKGYEVIYISEPVDEMCFASVGSFMNKAIVDAAKEISDSESDEEKKKKEESNEELSGLRLWIKQILGTKVTKVEASTRLVNSPATIIQSEYGVSPNMQRYLKAQAVADSIDDPSSTSRIFNQAVFELNPEHPIVLDLKDLYEHDPTSTAAKERVELLFQTAALSAGYLLDNSVEYAQQVVDLMTKLSKNVARTAASLSSTATDTAVEAPVVREKNEI